MEETKMFKQVRNETQQRTVIRNLLDNRVLSSRLGDGGCSSAMTVKGSMLVSPSFLSLVGLLFVLLLSGCQTEKKLAKQYMAQHRGGGVFPRTGRSESGV